MNKPSPKRQIPQRRATARSLPIALLRARERVMQPIRAMLAEANVTEAQWRVLRVLEEIGPTDATEIAHEACLLMPSLTRILQGLEEKGLTARSAHPSDGRKQLVTITLEGEALIARHIEESNRIYGELEAAFGEDRVEVLLDLLNELARLER
ncbi:homoprotocatechuate degradation operon regulator HpaR [Psychromarinibacter sp. C21-152]|uniref:Homoprotocatechuate degradation operon regulator HpaR n=1 Tax=Psychromarinibacter sediminicola TaxID=3033385 RepID=A0AAE3NQ16_9RHOB|nr:homoprotocatechuate degradation operon regulator HpaR [Psychromarinibacter sediminicola]MDF0601423.1 homoprotocatechuate degradation operon regulator HpaR [Psychromarinibacter sediminicola]